MADNSPRKFFEMQEFVEFALDQFYSHTKNKYHMSKDDMLQYILFYLLTELKQKDQRDNEPSFSLQEFVRKKYQDGIYQGTSPNDLLSDSIYMSDYDKLHEHYTKLNFEKELETKRVQERNDPKEARFKGKDIYQYQLDELCDLEDQYNEPTYRRLRENHLHRIEYQEYKDFVAKLKERIKEKADEDQNIRLYKLEKRLGFELIKKILKVKYELEQELEAAILKDLVVVLTLPDIKSRQDYVDWYRELISRARAYWRAEVASIPLFLSNVITMSRELAQASGETGGTLTDKEKELLGDYCKDESYVNDYDIDKDFKKKDFKQLMKILKDINAEAREKAGLDESK